MKYIIAIFVTAVLVFLAATVYYKGIPSFAPYQKTAVTTQNSQVIATLVPIASPAASASASPLAKNIITAGGILVFDKYSLELPAGWTSSTAGSSPGQIDKLTLTKGAYKMIISQAAFGGGACLFPGDVEQSMSVSFTGFSELTGAGGQKFRVGVLPAGNRAVCQFQSGSWGNITEFGHIDITNPTTPTQSMLDEINVLLSSLKKI